jgi:outer membrane receptor for ferrienterochelin and colicin
MGRSQVVDKVTVLLLGIDLKPEKSINIVSFNWDNNDNLNAGLTLFNSEFR